VQQGKRYALVNLVSGDLMPLLAGGYSKFDRLEEYRCAVEFCAGMNLEHVPGSDHVIECHCGDPQQYAVYDLEDKRVIADFQ